MWPSTEALHSMFHVSLSLASVPSDFNLSSDYLQSLMMVVVLVLGLGFVVLVLLAVYLCLIVSFMQPTDMPSKSFRQLCITLAIAISVCAQISVMGNEQWEAGMASLLATFQQLHQLAAQVRQQAHALADSSVQLRSHAHDIALCEGCLPAGNKTVNASVCTALLHDSETIATASSKLVDSTDAGPTHVQRVTNMLLESTSWHDWAAALPCYTLLVTCCAVVLGTVLGRRNLLIGAQFIVVIVWWMMCAVVSVEFAIAVGMSDACLQPLETIDRVLRYFARNSNGDLDTYYMTMSWLGPCDEALNPLVALILSAQQGTFAIEGNITEVRTSCSAVEPLLVDVQSVLKSIEQQLDLMATCGGKGAIGELFDQGIVHSLCVDMMAGVVGVFVWQLACGGLLLVLAVLLPGLWHSHFFPPMFFRCRPYRGFLELRDMMSTSAEGVSEPPLGRGLQVAADVEGSAVLPGLAPLQVAPEAVDSFSGDVGCAPPSHTIPRECSSHDVL